MVQSGMGFTIHQNNHISAYAFYERQTFSHQLPIERSSRRAFPSHFRPGISCCSDVCRQTTRVSVRRASSAVASFVAREGS